MASLLLGALLNSIGDSESPTHAHSTACTPRDRPLAVHMARTSALLLTISLAATLAAKRTRYEIRDLNQSQWDQVVDVIWFMKNTTNHTLGVELYGPDFRSYDAFVIKHAVSSLDERGDQGHFGPPFMTFHRAYLLEIENSFLAILKVVFGAKAQIDAMPYWNPRCVPAYRPRNACALSTAPTIAG